MNDGVLLLIVFICVFVMGWLFWDCGNWWEEK